MILLIGGLGNVGLNLADEMLRNNISFTILGRQSAKSVNILYPQFNYLELDAVQTSNWNLNKKFKTAVNLAYSSSNFANNVIYENKKLMRNIYRNNNSFENIIHISTTAVAGYGSKIPSSLIKTNTWDDFYTLAKSIQEKEIYNNQYPFKVVRIANFLGKNSIFLKSLAILTQLEINKDDFDFNADLTSTYDIVRYLNNEALPDISNLMTSNNLSWANIIDYTKKYWNIVDEISYDYTNSMNFMDNKNILRRLSKLIPSNFEDSIEIAIKRSQLMLNLTQRHISNTDHINTIFRVKRHSKISNQNKVDEKFFKYLKSLSENAFNYRLK